MVSAPSAMFSSDPDLLEDPETFDGFRWYKKSLEAEGSAVSNTNLVTTSARPRVRSRKACMPWPLLRYRGDEDPSYFHHPAVRYQVP